MTSRSSSLCESLGAKFNVDIYKDGAVWSVAFQTNKFLDYETTLELIKTEYIQTL